MGQTRYGPKEPLERPPEPRTPILDPKRDEGTVHKAPAASTNHPKSRPHDYCYYNNNNNNNYYYYYYYYHHYHYYHYSHY